MKRYGERMAQDLFAEYLKSVCVCNTRVCAFMCLHKNVCAVGGVVYEFVAPPKMKAAADV